jgi:cholesterol 25-hydroxylase
MWLRKDKVELWMSTIWSNYLRKSKLFQHDSFEPTLSSLVFIINMFVWYVIDAYIPSLHQYRIQKSNTMEPWNGLRWKEPIGYLLPWLVVDFFYPRRKLPIDPPTLFRLIREVFVGLLLYDLFFFIGHFAFHKIKYLYHKVHATHHTNYTVRASDSIRHTLIDGSYDVMCSVMALNLQYAHPMSRALYDIIAVTLLCEAHSGTNFPCMLHNLIPGRLFAGPVLHDIHHRHGMKNFQKYFTYLDWLCGTLETERSE